MVTNDRDTINGKLGESAPPTIDLKTFIAEEMRRKREADEAARRDPALRLAMVELIADLGELIGNAAAKLAGEKGITSAFEIDRLGDTIAWQTVEFLAQGAFERDPNEAQICKAFQIDQYHAMDWFEVGIPAPGGQPFALESEVQS
jgi:hypothetical protein